MTFPRPDLIAQAHSEKLLDLIKQEIVSKGEITFARYMEMALYHPTLGYYSAGTQKFGKSGDFVTAPEISPLFAQCIARQCQQILKKLPNGSILEFGAGSGIMAVGLLLELEKMDSLPQYYWIIEVSADLKTRQKETVKQKIPHLLEKIKWLNTLPEKPFEGILLANEVLDAMPVNRFKQEETVKEYYVGLKDKKLVWMLDKPSTSSIKQKVSELNLPSGYTSEINLAISPWINALDNVLKKGLILLIDYGFTQDTYYHPQRSMGTLICHYQHHAHDDLLLWAGIQDITAHVDFTAIEKAANSCGLTVAGFANQANFLINCGLTQLLSSTKNSIEQFEITQQAKKLIMPTEMGELFKVIALTKNLNLPLLGF